MSGAGPIAALPRLIPGASRIADQGGSTEDEKAADVDISLLRDAAEALSASCRALLWCQTEKGKAAKWRADLNSVALATVATHPVPGSLSLARIGEVE